MRRNRKLSFYMKSCEWESIKYTIFVNFASKDFLQSDDHFRYPTPSAQSWLQCNNALLIEMSTSTRSIELHRQESSGYVLMTASDVAQVKNNQDQRL